MGNIALAAGKPADAASRFDESLKLLAKAKVSDEVKENARRNNLFNVGRVALKRVTWPRHGPPPRSTPPRWR
jgi:hypothetical protein